MYALRRLAPVPGVGSEGALNQLEPGVDGVVLEVCSTIDRAPVVCPAEELGEESRSSAEIAQRPGGSKLEEVLRSSQVELLLWVRVPQVLDAVAKIVEDIGAASRAYVVVEDPLHVRVVRSKSSKVRTVLKLANPFPNVPLLAKEGVNALALPASVLRPRVVRECSNRGIDVVAWLVNDVSQAIKAVRYGVKLLVTSRSNLKKEIQQYLETR